MLTMCTKVFYEWSTAGLLDFEAEGPILPATNLNLRMIANPDLGFRLTLTFLLSTILVFYNINKCNYVNLLKPFVKSDAEQFPLGQSLRPPLIPNISSMQSRGFWIIRTLDDGDKRQENTSVLGRLWTGR